MGARDLVKDALRALTANRGRSLLTILGIVIGISAVIAMTSLIGGFRNALVDGLGLNAARAIYVNAWDMLEEGDLEKIGRQVPGIESISGSISGSDLLKGKDKDWNVSVNGVDETYLDSTGQTSRLAAGRSPSKEEIESGTRVALVGRSACDYLRCGVEEALGKTLKLHGKSYVIVGVADDGDPGEGFFNCWVPLSCAKLDFAGTNAKLGSIVALAREGEDPEALQEDLKLAIARMGHIPDEEIEGAVSTYTMQSAINQLDGMMTVFQAIGISVASISLLVGGIGIMNMMLTNVSERVHEIGVRRALGARSRDITRQFLIESAVLCVLGGILGTIAGYLLAWGAAGVVTQMNVLGSITGGGSTATFAPAIDPMAICGAVSVSILIGIVFGFYPARRAARLDPVECLRYQ
ncbi:MAG: ABC transporter permease [Coriobacteriaceae bacterium]|nr:ABC transporter permease [Coriobacteriaceae bacterium]